MLHYKAIEPSMEWFVVVHVLTISLNGRNWKVCGPIVLTVHRQETARQHDTSWPNVNEVDNKWIEADNVSMFPAVSWTSPGGIHLLYMTMWEPSTWSNCLLPRVRGMRVRPHRQGSITLQGLLTLMFCPSSMKLLIMSNNPL